MQAQFKITMANDAKNVQILWKDKPESIEEHVKCFQSILCAFGFPEDVVRRYFEMEDIIIEYEEQIKELENTIAELKGRTFRVAEGGKK